MIPLIEFQPSTGYARTPECTWTLDMPDLTGREYPTEPKQILRLFRSAFATAHRFVEQNVAEVGRMALRLR
jgi:hypothetical protein